MRKNEVVRTKRFALMIRRYEEERQREMLWVSERQQDLEEQRSMFNKECFIPSRQARGLV